MIGRKFHFSRSHRRQSGVQVQHVGLQTCSWSLQDSAGGESAWRSSAVSSISLQMWCWHSQKLCFTLLEQSPHFVLLSMNRSCWRAERLEAAAFSSAWFQSHGLHHWPKPYFQWEKLLLVGRHIEIQIKCWIFFLGVASNVTFNFQNSVQLPFCAPALHPGTETPSQSRNSWMAVASTLECVQGEFLLAHGEDVPSAPPPHPPTLSLRGQ